jgi:hypothetical protein
VLVAAVVIEAELLPILREATHLPLRHARVLLLHELLLLLDVMSLRVLYLVDLLLLLLLLQLVLSQGNGLLRYLLGRGIVVVGVRTSRKLRVLPGLDLLFDLGLRNEVGRGRLRVRDVSDVLLLVAARFRGTLLSESGVLRTYSSGPTSRSTWHL